MERRPRSPRPNRARATSGRRPANRRPVAACAAAGSESADPDLKSQPLGKASDEELMRRAQNGDRQAFSIVYERYNAAVLSYLYRMLGNVEDVESIGRRSSSAPSASRRPTATRKNSRPGCSRSRGT
jgi:hypothetical protein